MPANKPILFKLLQKFNAGDDEFNGVPPFPNKLNPQSNFDGTNIDSWFCQSDSSPFKRIFPIAAIAASLFFIPVISQSENITLDKWYQPVSQPLKQFTRQNLGGESRFEVPRTIIITDWFQAISEPVKRKPIQLLGGDVRTDIEAITMDKWVQPVAQPYFSKRRDVPYGEYRFEVPRTILITDWFQPASEPIRRKLTQLLGGDTRTEIETITFDKWQQPLNQPYFSKRRDIPSGEYRFELPRIIIISDWYQQASEPVRNKIRQLFDSNFRTEVVTSPEIITIDKWYNQISQPNFSKLRNVYTGEFRFEVPREILISDWYQQSDDPSRQIIIHYYSQKGRLFIIRETKAAVLLDAPDIEDITIDKWYQPISQPYIKIQINFIDEQLNVLLNDTPPPILEYISSRIVFEEGGSGTKSKIAKEENEYHRRLRLDDEEVFEIIKMWFKCQG